MEQIPKEFVDAIKDADDYKKAVSTISKALDVLEKSLARLADLLVEAFKDLARSVAYAVKINLGYAATVVKFASYYGMAVLGMRYAIIPDRIGVALILFIPMFVQLFSFILGFTAERLHPRKELPIPKKRFTEVNNDGEVSVDRARLQELLLYVADVEDYLERQGKL